MSIASRVKQLEKDLILPDDSIFIIVGNPTITLYGQEARTHYEQEKAAGRLVDPKTDGGFEVCRSCSVTVYLPEELRDAGC